MQCDFLGHLAMSGTTQFAVVEVENTGISPLLDDRVLEFTAQRLNANGGHAEGFAMFVDPGRDPGIQVE